MLWLDPGVSEIGISDTNPISYKTLERTLTEYKHNTFPKQDHCLSIDPILDILYATTEYIHKFQTEEHLAGYLPGTGAWYSEFRVQNPFGPFLVLD